MKTKKILLFNISLLNAFQFIMSDEAFRDLNVFIKQK